MPGSFPPVSEDLCREFLDRVVSSATFSRADQLRRLLQWLGEASLQNNSQPPGEKEIAERVLNRPDFDPQADSLVRKEMSRLREKLTRYYLTEGARDEIRINCSGGYLLRFEPVMPRPRKTRVERPCLLVLPLRCEQTLAAAADSLLDEMLVKLGQHHRIELVAPTTSRSYAGRKGDVREFATECGADYVVEGTLQRRGERMELTLWLVDGHTGRTRQPARVHGHGHDEVAVAGAVWLAEQISPRPDLHLIP